MALTMGLFEMITTEFPDAKLGEVKEMGDFLIAFHKSSPEMQEQIRAILGCKIRMQKRVKDLLDCQPEDYL